MNAKSFARTVGQIERRLDEMGLDLTLDARDASGRVLWRGSAYDHRLKPNHHPQLARRSQTVTCGSCGARRGRK